MTPPVGCWTFFTWLSTTIVPGATTAPDSSVVQAQPAEAEDEQGDASERNAGMAFNGLACSGFHNGAHDAAPRAQADLAVLG